VKTGVAPSANTGRAIEDQADIVVEAVDNMIVGAAADKGLVAAHMDCRVLVNTELT